MTKEAAELLTQYNGEIHDDYSGRGMFGETTIAVSFDSMKEFYIALADAIENITNDDFGEPEEQQETICSMLKSIKTDNLGMGIIIY